MYFIAFLYPSQFIISKYDLLRRPVRRLKGFGRRYDAQQPKSIGIVNRYIIMKDGV